MLRQSLVVFSFCNLIWLVSSCDGDTNSFDKINDFDQQPLLENLADNLIVPAYKTLTEQAGGLTDSIDLLVDDVSQVNLIKVRDQLKATRMAWQQCSFYEMGPAENRGLTSALNIYPVDKNQIAQNISSGEYDLSAVSNLDASGFPALEYLLYGEDQADEQILNSLDQATFKYLTDVAEHIESTCAQVYTDWSSYSVTFTSESALGVDVGSSVGQLVNGFIRHFERHTRDGKIGIPVGERTLGDPEFHRCEAYYAGYSLELFWANIEAYHEMFLGADGVGFDDYLNGIGDATTGNEDLANQIDAQFNAIKAAAQPLSDPLPGAITNQKTQVQLVFNEMQSLVALFKIDMASSMGVTISYQDTDGD